MQPVAAKVMRLKTCCWSLSSRDANSFSGETDGTYYIASELIEGETLRRRVETGEVVTLC